jgi:hypothetical protein
MVFSQKPLAKDAAIFFLKVWQMIFANKPLAYSF